MPNNVLQKVSSNVGYSIEFFLYKPKLGRNKYMKELFKGT